MAKEKYEIVNGKWVRKGEKKKAKKSIAYLIELAAETMQ